MVNLTNTSDFYHQLRLLRSVVLPDPINSPANVGTVNPSQRKKRITFLFLEAVSQILYMGFSEGEIGYDKFGLYNSI